MYYRQSSTTTRTAAVAWQQGSNQNSTIVMVCFYRFITVTELPVFGFNTFVGTIYVSTRSSLNMQRTENSDMVDENHQIANDLDLVLAVVTI